MVDLTVKPIETTIYKPLFRAALLDFETKKNISNYMIQKVDRHNFLLFRQLKRHELKSFKYKKNELIRYKRKTYYFLDNYSSKLKAINAIQRYWNLVRNAYANLGMFNDQQYGDSRKEKSMQDYIKFLTNGSIDSNLKENINKLSEKEVYEIATDTLQRYLVHQRENSFKKIINPLDQACTFCLSDALHNIPDLLTDLPELKNELAYLFHLLQQFEKLTNEISLIPTKYSFLLNLKRKYEIIYRKGNLNEENRGC